MTSEMSEERMGRQEWKLITELLSEDYELMNI